MAHSILCLTHDNTLNQRGRRGKNLLRAFLNKAMGTMSGGERGSNFTLVGSGTDLVAANSAGISASGSGTIGIVIAGVTLTGATGASDIIDAGMIAAVINASTNAKIQYLFGSTNLKSTLSLSTVLAGTTVTLAGFRFTAIAGTAENGKDGDFVIGGDNTADANSLALAINRHPYANKYLFAIPAVADCHVFPKAAAWWTAATAFTPNIPANAVKASATTVTVGSATFAASNYYGIWCKIPGKLGNNVVLAASGTGQTIIGSATYMARGLGMDALPVTDNL
jgi:hypothetical protein